MIPPGLGLLEGGLMRRFGISFALVLALLLSAKPAMAAPCNLSQFDLSGNWQIYITSGTPAVSWARVKITIAASGLIGAGPQLVDANGTRATVTGGRMTMDTFNCLVTGRILVKTSFPTALPMTINHGVLSQDINTIVGVGRDTRNAPFTFTAVKVP